MIEICGKILLIVLGSLIFILMIRAIVEIYLFRIVGDFRHCKKCGSIHEKKNYEDFNLSSWVKHSVWNHKCICNIFAEEK